MSEGTFPYISAQLMTSLRLSTHFNQSLSIDLFNKITYMLY